MLTTLLAMALLGAPENAGAALRIAWASQYEWKESGVENVVLEFAYTNQWHATDSDNQSHSEARGQIVVVGSEIVRRHLPGVSETRRKTIEPHLAWVLERFVRKPFEEEFEDMTFGGPEPTEEGFLRVSVAPRDNPEAKSFEILGGPRAGSTREGRGVAEYSLKKVKVSLPR